MLDKNFNLRIIDFGLVAPLKVGDGLMRAEVGTPAYKAPEIIMKIPYDGKQIDVFSLGVIFFSLYAGS